MASRNNSANNTKALDKKALDELTQAIHNLPSYISGTVQNALSVAIAEYMNKEFPKMLNTFMAQHMPRILESQKDLQGINESVKLLHTKMCEYNFSLVPTIEKMITEMSFTKMMSSLSVGAQIVLARLTLKFCGVDTHNSLLKMRIY